MVFCSGLQIGRKFRKNLKILPKKLISLTAVWFFAAGYREFRKKDVVFCLFPAGSDFSFRLNGKGRSVVLCNDDGFCAKVVDYHRLAYKMIYNSVFNHNK